MIDNLLRFAIDRRGLMLSLVLVVIAFGLWRYQQLPIDAVPDITNVQVQINTQAPGYSPLETEQRITYPIERALASLPQLAYTRSISAYGLSQITVVFVEGTGRYFARDRISQVLATINQALPTDVVPEMGPIASGLGEIFQYTVSAKPDALQADGTPYDLTALREIQDWYIAPRLELVAGVTEINTMGGEEKQYHVQPSPDKLLTFQLSLSDIEQALSANNTNQGAGYIDRQGQQILVRSVGQLQTMDEIRQVVVAQQNGIPITIADVAEVAIGKTLRTGAATRDGQETVLGTAMMLMGENAREVAHDVAKALTEINSSLPAGVVAEPVYDRTRLVDKTIQTVQKNLIEGALLVIVVLFLLLGNLRAAFITAAVIPLTMLATITGMVEWGISANLMSLGALDFGLIVDGAVIIVENSVRRLALAQQQNQGVLALNQRLQVVYDATQEVIRPSLLGVLIITLVYIPLFSLTGVEGKMFEPMAATVVIALSAAMIFTLTLVPAAVAVLMSGKINIKESPVMNGAKSLYRPLLLLSLRLRWLVVTTAVVLIVLAAVGASRMGSEFIPQLDEGDIALHAVRITGTSLQQSITMQQLVEQQLTQLPQVKTVFSKIGTPEIATDPMPPNVADTFVMLAPRDEWPDPSLSKADLLAHIQTKLDALPGNNYEYTQPIEMRFNELLSGVRSDLAIKVFGDDLTVLLQTAEQIKAQVTSVAGAADVRVEQVSGLPVLTLIPKRVELARYGLTVDALQQWLATAIGGKTAGQIYEGDKRFELVVRLPETIRSDIQRLQFLPVALPNGDYVPLSEIATLEQTEMPAQISRENGKRRIVVTANIRERDLGSFVTELQQNIETNLTIPDGYWLSYGGTYEQLLSATMRLTLVIIVTLAFILALLVTVLRSLKSALIIFTGVPLALTGGVLALWLRDMPLSISAGVGFIALSGIAVLNGLVMLSFIRSEWQRQGNLDQAIVQGALTRLRPVMMTALVASLGFVPMAFNVGIGAEVQRPLATVVIGGIISSTLLTLLVLPALYKLVYQRDKTPIRQSSAF